MAKHKIEPKVNLDEYFRGLARQDLDFHQALCELVDNALSARTMTKLGATKSKPNPAIVEIVVDQVSDARVQISVADAGIGMTIADLQNHVFGLGQRGRTSSAAGSMNEHGFGLKNALAVLTGGDSTRVSLVSRSEDDGLTADQFLTVSGPFASAMDADDSGTRKNDWAPGLQILSGVATGTKVQVESDIAYFRTVWTRRGAASQFPAYVTRLAEHLGVLYREFIDSGDTIYLSWRALGGSWSEPIPLMAIKPPYGNHVTARIPLNVGGRKIDVGYTYGENDYQIRDEGPEPDRKTVGHGDPSYPYPLKIYYQGSSSRSGADIVVRRRVIRTQAWKEIWPDIDHTVDYNRWLAEINLDDNFHTTNNKAGMDPNDPAWQALVDVLGDKDGPYTPEKTSPKQTEKSIEDQLAEHLRVQVADPALVAQQVGTWAGATTADIVVYETASRTTVAQIFEVKAVRGTVDDVYQLVCQWDGFVKDGLKPKEGILYCKTSDHKPATAIAELNKRKDGNGNNYNLRISHLVGASASTPKKPPIGKKTAATKRAAKKSQGSKRSK
ncbi:hypothetical protein ABIE44_002728 [Marmoricola sp. OAE513]|uniref:ATP-binding protein n=1 Tax=Marmoricola sp. OAE513 TaxID=2817894 RepID=UPI001AE14EEF